MIGGRTGIGCEFPTHNPTHKLGSLGCLARVLAVPASL